MSASGDWKASIAFSASVDSASPGSQDAVSLFCASVSLLPKAKPKTRMPIQTTSTTHFSRW